jgi:hypothetical protein
VIASGGDASEARLSDTPAKKPDPLKDLLDRLVPPQAVQIVDLFGNEYRIPTAISARRNVEVTRKIQEVIAHPAAERALARADLLLGGGDGLAEAVVHLVGLVASDEVIEALAAALHAAHPGLYIQARHRAIEAQADLPDEGDLADLFAVEEIAAALVPLFVRLAKRSVQALHVVSEAVGTDR